MTTGTMRIVRRFGTLGLVAIACATSGWTASAQPVGRTLKVATRVVQPFVFEEKGELTGFSIELWREISQQLGVQSEFVVQPSIEELLRSVQSNEAALGIAAISITAERERDLDFSQPMFDAGLQILVPAQGGSGLAIREFVGTLFSGTVLSIIGLVVLTIVLTAHIVWLFERRRSSGVVSGAYYPGIFEAAWWAASTLATQADQMPRAAAARIVAVIWMFASVVFIAYFTASVTSTLTLRQLRGDINGPDDLPGKRVGTIRGSTAAEYLRQRNISAVEETAPEAAFRMLLDGQLDAVVYDAPVVLFYASHEGRGKAAAAGPIFRKENYGIVLPSDSPYRKALNEALLKIKESGIYDRLYAKWFSAEGS